MNAYRPTSTKQREHMEAVQSAIDSGTMKVIDISRVRPCDRGPAPQSNMLAGEWYQTGHPMLDLKRLLPAGEVKEAAVSEKKVMLGQTEVEFGKNEYRRPGIKINRWTRWLPDGKTEWGLGSCLHACGRTGKQSNFYTLTARQKDGQIEIDTTGKTKSIITLAEWQAFVDSVPVRVADISRNTIGPLTPALEKMARDVCAFRRDDPTVKEWAKEIAPPLDISKVKPLFPAEPSPEDKADNPADGLAQKIRKAVEAWPWHETEHFDLGDGYELDFDPTWGSGVIFLSHPNNLPWKTNIANRANEKLEMRCIVTSGQVSFYMDAVGLNDLTEELAMVERWHELASAPGYDWSCGMQPKAEWECEFMALMAAEWFSRALAESKQSAVSEQAPQPEKLTVLRNGEKLIDAEFVEDGLRYKFSYYPGGPLHEKTMAKDIVIHMIKDGTLKITGPRPEWAQVEQESKPPCLVEAAPAGQELERGTPTLAEAVNSLQDKSDALAPYGFSEQKKRRLERIDELIEACKVAIAEPDNADAQKLIDNYSLVRKDGEVFLTHPKALREIHIGTGTLYDCQRWAMVQFFNHVKWSQKKDPEEPRLAQFLRQQVDGLIGDIEAALKKSHDITLRSGLKLGCIIEEEEHGLWLHHPIMDRGVESGVQVASRRHATSELVSRIDRDEILKLVQRIREVNDQKRAEQSTVLKAVEPASKKQGVSAT